jgi:hypothetical protein
MAERTKKTVYVGGLPDGADAAMLVNAFTAFGEVVDVQIPQEGECSLLRLLAPKRTCEESSMSRTARRCRA